MWNTLSSELAQGGIGQEMFGRSSWDKMIRPHTNHSLHITLSIVSY